MSNQDSSMMPPGLDAFLNNAKDLDAGNMDQKIGDFMNSMGMGNNPDMVSKVSEQIRQSYRNVTGSDMPGTTGGGNAKAGSGSDTSGSPEPSTGGNNAGVMRSESPGGADMGNYTAQMR